MMVHEPLSCNDRCARWPYLDFRFRIRIIGIILLLIYLKVILMMPDKYIVFIKIFLFIILF